MGGLTVWRAAARSVAVACVFVWGMTAALAGEITGTVVDDRGEAVPGVWVSVFRLLPPGSTVDADRASLLLAAGVSPREIEDAGRRSVTLSLQAPFFSRAAKSDAGGAFAIHDVPPGSYRLRVRATGHTFSYDRDVVIEEDAPLRLHIRGARLCPLTGKITLKSGEPLANAEVTLYFLGPRGPARIGVETGPDGTYKASRSNPRLYDVLLKVPGYATVERPRVELVRGERVAGVDFVLDAPSGSIAGTVYESDGETPKPRATVRLEGVGDLAWERNLSRLQRQAMDSPRDEPQWRSEAPRATTSPDGRFVLGDIPQGRYELKASVIDYRGAPSEPIVVGRSENVTDVTIVLRRASSISGTIYGLDGEPLANDRVRGYLVELHEGRRERSSRTFATDEQGRYGVRSMRPGPYEVQLWPDDAARTFRQVQVGEGEDLTDIDLWLTEGSALTVLVSGPDGRPVGDATARAYRRVDARRYSRHPPRKTTGQDGRAVFEHLADGTYWGGVAAEGQPPACVGPIEVRDGETLPELQIGLKEGATIYGRVVNENGRPVPRAEVRVNGSVRDGGPILSAGPRRTLSTDDDGSFAVRGVAGGRWTFEVEAPGYVKEYARTQVGDEGECDVEVVIRRE